MIAFIKFFGGIVFMFWFNVRVRNISRSILSPDKCFFLFRKKKKSHRENNRALGENMNFYFLKIRSHHLGFMCLGVVVKKPNVANSRLLSLSFVMFELLMCYQNPRCLFHGYLKNCASIFRLLVLLLSEFSLLLSSLLSLLLVLRNICWLCDRYL